MCSEVRENDALGSGETEGWVHGTQTLSASLDLEVNRRIRQKDRSSGLYYSSFNLMMKHSCLYINIFLVYLQNFAIFIRNLNLYKCKGLDIIMFISSFNIWQKILDDNITEKVMCNLSFSLTVFNLQTSAAEK